jgi:hypothetical protein
MPQLSTSMVFVWDMIERVECIDSRFGIEKEVLVVCVYQNVSIMRRKLWLVDLLDPGLGKIVEDVKNVC